MTSRTVCSAAPRWRDQHTIGRREYQVTDPDGRQFSFCSAACLLSFAVYGLPADVQADDFDLEPIADTVPRRDTRNEAAA